MIPYRTIYRTIGTLLKDNFKGYEVHFSTNFCAKVDYFYIEFAEKQTAVDEIYRQRDIDAEIHFVPVPDCRGRIARHELHQVLDKLVGIFMQLGDTIKVLPTPKDYGEKEAAQDEFTAYRYKPRFITISDVTSRVVNEVLIFSFRLSFVDNVEQEPVELMEELYQDGYKEASPLMVDDAELDLNGNTKGE